MSRWIVIFSLGFLLSADLQAVENGFDQLLREVQQSRQHEAGVRDQRKQAFFAKEQEQVQLLEKTRQLLAAERQRSDELKASFTTNEDELVTLEADLQQRTGDLGEVFGAVRQTARDLAPLIRESMVSAQLPGRAQWLETLGESKRLPEIEKLGRLWQLMQGEIAESGRVVRMPAAVISPDGRSMQSSVVRVGLFNALEGRQYLKYQPESGQFAVLPRQPAGRLLDIVGQFTHSSSGYHAISVDPTRGVLLGLLVETPDPFERMQQGGLVGYAILLLGAIGLLLVLFRLIYLSWIGGRIRRQLKRLDAPSANNPLGRILALSVNSREIDPVNLELQIDEAVLREIPRLTRGEAMVKLLAGVAPLLGLLGTVVGMIVTFQSISLFGTGDPKLMANGISQALVTTALGLIVAIPLLFLHSLLASRSKVLVQILDEQSAGLAAIGRESR